MNTRTLGVMSQIRPFDPSLVPERAGSLLPCGLWGLIPQTNQHLLNEALSAWLSCCSINASVADFCLRGNRHHISACCVREKYSAPRPPSSVPHKDPQEFVDPCLWLHFSSWLLFTLLHCPLPPHTCAHTSPVSSSSSTLKMIMWLHFIFKALKGRLHCVLLSHYSAQRNMTLRWCLVSCPRTHSKLSAVHCLLSSIILYTSLPRPMFTLSPLCSFFLIFFFPVWAHAVSVPHAGGKQRS